MGVGGRPGRRGGGARGRGTRGEEGAGSQSGSIRFSHRPRRGSQQPGRRRPGSPAPRRLSARRGPQAPARAPAPPACPRGRSALPRGRPRRSPRGGRRACRRSRPPRRWKRSPRRPPGRISHQTRKCQQRGREEQRENRPRWLTKKLKKTCLQKTEKRKTRRVQPLMKQKRKKPSPINTIHHVLQWSLSPFLYNPEEYFYQLFCKCKFFSSSRNIFKKEGSPPHPIF